MAFDCSSAATPARISKEDETWDAWEPSLGPSVALHAAVYAKGGSPIGWPRYRARYLQEQRDNQDLIRKLAERSRAGETITLLCSSACTARIALSPVAAQRADRGGAGLR